MKLSKHLNIRLMLTAAAVVAIKHKTTKTDIDEDMSSIRQAKSKQQKLKLFFGISLFYHFF